VDPYFSGILIRTSFPPHILSIDSLNFEYSIVDKESITQVACTLQHHKITLTFVLSKHKE
jgi:hypothetical protein